MISNRNFLLAFAFGADQHERRVAEFFIEGGDDAHIVRSAMLAGHMKAAERAVTRRGRAGGIFTTAIIILRRCHVAKMPQTVGQRLSILQII
jgi:hypothetical protein